MANKPMQTRFTLEDTLVYQGKLRKKIQELRFENRPLTNAERKDFYESLAKGLLARRMSFLNRVGLRFQAFKIWRYESRIYERMR